jgi:hypothetical protein
MSHRSRRARRAVADGAALLTIVAHSVTLAGASRTVQRDALTKDPVVARVHEHFGEGGRPLVLVVDSHQFPPGLWKRVKHLVAFRLHRPQPDGSTRADAATYLVRDSDLYFKAAKALRDRSTIREYVWCLLAAVLAHESAHTAPATERQALAAEAAQLRRCLSAGHLHSTDGWDPLAYLQKVDAKLLAPREHY